MNSLLRHVRFILGSLLLWLHPLQAGNLIDVAGTGSGSQSINPGKCLAISFRLNVLATNVTITAPIIVFLDSTGSLVLIKNRIGATADPADTIASRSYTASAAGTLTTPLFTGLTLPPGDYFLVLKNTTGSAAVWPGVATSVVTRDPSVTPLVDYRAETAAAFGPQSTFSAIVTGKSLKYTVTGDLRPFRITQIVRANVGGVQGFNLTFNSEPNSTYIIEYTSTLGGWTSAGLSSFPSTGLSTVGFIDQLNIPKEFYRMRKL